MLQELIYIVTNRSLAIKCTEWPPEPTPTKIMPSIYSTALFISSKYRNTGIQDQEETIIFLVSSKQLAQKIQGLAVSSQHNHIFGITAIILSSTLCSCRDANSILCGQFIFSSQLGFSAAICVNALYWRQQLRIYPTSITLSSDNSYLSSQQTYRCQEIQTQPSPILHPTPIMTTLITRHSGSHQHRTYRMHFDDGYTHDLPESVLDFTLLDQPIFHPTTRRPSNHRVSHLYHNIQQPGQIYMKSSFELPHFPIRQILRIGRGPHPIQRLFQFGVAGGQSKILEVVLDVFLRQFIEGDPAIQIFIIKKIDILPGRLLPLLVNTIRSHLSLALLLELLLWVLQLCRHSSGHDGALRQQSQVVIAWPLDPSSFRLRLGCSSIVVEDEEGVWLGVAGGMHLVQLQNRTNDWMICRLQKLGLGSPERV